MSRFYSEPPKEGRHIASGPQSHIAPGCPMPNASKLGERHKVKQADALISRLLNFSVHFARSSFTFVLRPLKSFGGSFSIYWY